MRDKFERMIGTLFLLARQGGSFHPGILPCGNSQAFPVGFRPFRLVAEAAWRLYDGW